MRPLMSHAAGARSRQGRRVAGAGTVASENLWEIEIFKWEQSRAGAIGGRGGKYAPALTLVIKRYCAEATSYPPPSGGFNGPCLVMRILRNKIGYLNHMFILLNGADREREISSLTGRSNKIEKCQVFLKFWNKFMQLFNHWSNFGCRKAYI